MNMILMYCTFWIKASLHASSTSGFVKTLATLSRLSSGRRYRRVCSSRPLHHQDVSVETMEADLRSPDHLGALLQDGNHNHTFSLLCVSDIIWSRRRRSDDER